MNSFFKKNGPLISTYFIIAIVFWLIFLIIIPQLYMLDLSFRPNLPPLLRGGHDDVHTLTHYKHFIFGSESSEDPYNYVDIGVFFNTIFTAKVNTIEFEGNLKNIYLKINSDMNVRFSVPNAVDTSELSSNKEVELTFSSQKAIVLQKGALAVD